MPLSRLAEPFNHPDWIFEIKWDGFRSLAFIENGRCRLVSRKGNEFKSFPALNLALPNECRAARAVVDGEIVCLDDSGVSQFTDLLFRRGEPRFYAFDLLSLNGEDLRYLPLTDRKHRLRGIVPQFGQRLLYCDHIESAGQELFDLVCKRDLEGIVAKRKYDPYLLDGSAAWLKIRNTDYPQWAGREELFEFERERSPDPEWENWNACTLVCEQMIEADAF
jgi:bifunctional non-homologous end joining protein LigD